MPVAIAAEQIKPAKPRRYAPAEEAILEKLSIPSI